MGQRRETEVNVLSALQILSGASNEVKPHTISNCFKKAGFCTIEADDANELDFEAEDSETAMEDSEPAVEKNLETALFKSQTQNVGTKNFQRV